MSKVKISAFYLALLSLTAISVSVPALAESQGISTTTVKNFSSSAVTTEKGLSDEDLTVAATVTESSQTASASTAPQSDEVAPTDRSAQILKSLNQKYQCGVGEIDKTVTRSEFANSVVTCLEALEAKIANNPGEISATDMAQLKEMTNNFLSEVSALNNRVEAAEKKVAILQNGSSFSTTTKLAGEVIVGLSAISSQTGRPATDTNSGNIVVTDRVRLNFDASFNGKDRLRTRLESRNNVPFNGAAAINGGTGTNTTRLGWDGDEGNTTNLSLLQYTLPLANGSKLTLDATGSEFNENVYTFNPLLAAAGTGSLTRFGRFNPVYRQSGLGTAATLDYKFSPNFTGSIGYAVPLGVAATATTPATGANSPSENAGLFGGNYAALAQLRYQAAPNLDLGLSYSRSYHSTGAGVTGSTGSAFANNPFNGRPTAANHYSFSASSKLSPGFVLSGWVGLTNASAETGGTVTGNADIFNAAITAAFPDFGGKGNTLGFILGIPPTVSSISSNLPALAGRSNPDSALHLEALYKVKVSDNIDITPGVLLVTSPESTNAVRRGSEFVGTVRTTLRF
jgi:hypothetical protein